MPPKDPNRSDAFPQTRWTLVLRAREENDAQASLAMEEICSRYWYPLYAFLRGSGKSPTEAEDLTQSLFQRLIERDILKHADPEKGKLRTFLLTNLKKVMADAHRYTTAQKRGGNAVILSIDSVTAEQRFELETIDAQTDLSDLFDRTWALEILERAWGRLRASYNAKGRATLLHELQPHIGWNESDGDYKTIAKRMGLGTSAVRLHVFRMRKRLRQFLENEVAHTLADPAELEDEVRYVVRLISSQPPPANPGAFVP